MKNHSKMIQPARSPFAKPAKQRIPEASDKLFRIFGLRVGIGAIAHEANSNTETVLKYFGHQERLASMFVESLIQQAEQYWGEVEAKDPNNPEGRLRFWLFFEEQRKDDPLGPERLLSRTAAELAGEHPKHPLLASIEQYWQAERRRVVSLCEATRLREPRELADKLLLLVHGLRNERGAYGYHAPSRLLQQAANDLMVAHGATSKPPLEWTND